MTNKNNNEKLLNETESNREILELKNLNFQDKNQWFNFLKNMVESDKLSLKTISDIFLEVSKHLTGSKYCYIAYIDPENGDSVGISFSHLTRQCEKYEEMGEARFKLLKDGTYGGLLGYPLDTGESFYTHDITSHPAAHGLPPGHEPVEQFLSVPVKDRDKILGQIALANPVEDYSDQHLQITEKIAKLYAIALKNFLYKR